MQSSDCNVSARYNSTVVTIVESGTVEDEEKLDRLVIGHEELEKILDSNDHN